MIKIAKKLLLLISSLLLFGCTTNIPTKLGVSNLEWSCYSHEKQQKLLANYDKSVKERANIAKRNPVSNKSFIIGIYGGQVMFPPAFVNWQNFKPVQFVIFAEQCRDIELVHKSMDNIKTTLGACFYNDILYLDPSHYDLTKKYGSVSIHASPLWSAGFAYKGINSHGYTRLSNVTVAVKHGASVANNAKK